MPSKNKTWAEDFVEKAKESGSNYAAEISSEGKSKTIDKQKLEQSIKSHEAAKSQDETVKK